MTFTLLLAAIRRHPLSLGLSTLATIITASLTGVPAPMALALWAVAGFASFELWFALEPSILRRVVGCRQPSPAEYERLESALRPSHPEVLIAETPDLVATRGLRCVVIGRDLLDVFEDRALSGFLQQSVVPIHRANVAGCLLVWLANLPVLAAWCVGRLIGLLGRLLALVVGVSLVLPILIWRDAFLCWAGRAFCCLLVSLCAAALLSTGFAAAGLGLMLAWLVVPGVAAVLAWESRRVQRSADRLTVETGYGPQLLEAVDFLAVAGPQPPVSGLLRALCLPGHSPVDRAHAIRRWLKTA
jgi:hypothetical protein